MISLRNAKSNTRRLCNSDPSVSKVSSPESSHGHASAALGRDIKHASVFVLSPNLDARVSRVVFRFPYPQRSRQFPTNSPPRPSPARLCLGGPLGEAAAAGAAPAAPLRAAQWLNRPPGLSVSALRLDHTKPLRHIFILRPRLHLRGCQEN